MLQPDRKIEPRELAQASAAAFIERWPELQCAEPVEAMIERQELLLE